MVFDQQRIHAEIEALAPRIIADRRHLHQHAETSLKEFGTAQYISDRLDSLGIDHVGVGETGLLGTLTGADEGPTILLRADIDALPLLNWFVDEQIEEESTVSTIISRIKLIGNDGNGILRLDEELGARGTAAE